MWGTDAVATLSPCTRVIITTPSTQLQVEKLKETDAESDHGKPHHEHVEEGEDEHGRDFYGVATIRAQQRLDALRRLDNNPAALHRASRCLQLAELLVGDELPYDSPSPGTCGTCTACIDACPTGAIVAPFELDARRCLSYTTIEKRGFSAPELRKAQGEWLFGCDVCLEVCPFTSRSRRSSLAGEHRPKDLQPHRVVQSWTLIDVLEMDEERYQSEFVGTAMRRATRAGMRRNAAVVLGNRRQESALPHLRDALSDEDPVVRGHAAWAIAQMAPRDASLEPALRRESDERVRAELQHALDT